MKNWIRFNNVKINEELVPNMYISGPGVFKSPNKSYSLFSIPGRSGDLVMNMNRFENGELSYPAFITDNFDANFSILKNTLLSINGYGRLRDSYHPDEYRMALFRSSIDPSTDMFLNFGAFELVFECKPQRFLYSGNVERIFEREGTGTEEQTFVLNNPTLFNSRPLIKVYGSGTVTVKVNDITINLSDMDDYYYIDCDMMDVYRGSVSKNNKATFSNHMFPELIPGDNYISFSGNVSSVNVTPRWYIL